MVTSSFYTSEAPACSMQVYLACADRIIGRSRIRTNCRSGRSWPSCSRLGFITIASFARHNTCICQVFLRDIDRGFVG